MRIARLFKRSPKPKANKYDELTKSINDAVFKLTNATYKVNHNITRNVPQPISMTLWVEDGRGTRFHIGTFDLSYKNTHPIAWNPDLMRGFEERGTWSFMVELHYSPSIRGIA